MTRSNELIQPTIPSSPLAGSNRHLGTLLGIPHRADGKEHAATHHERPFPLTRVSLRARILADCATTELEEHFTNTSTEVMDITHTMPLPPDAAVSGFELIAGERRVAGVCMESAAAQLAFDDATERGKTAAMVRSVRGDVHVITLGQVAPGCDIVVRLRMSQRLRVHEGRFEYRFPTAIAPKFVPGHPIGHDGDGFAPDTDRAPDASSLTPPIRLDDGTPLALEILLPTDVSELTTSVPLTHGPEDGGFFTLRPAEPLLCSGDIVLRAWTRTATSGVRAYTDGARTLVVIDPPAKRAPDAELPCDAIFVLDRSGSMSGSRLTAAKESLIASIAALSERDTFAIIAFDDSIESFRAEPAPATATRKLEAAAWLAAIEARGGTELLPALAHACRLPTAAGRARVVLLATDGDVANDQEILALTRGLDPSTRIHAIGIGSAPSMDLLGRLARLARGTTLTIADGDNIAAEILRFQRSLRGPIAMNLRLFGDAKAISCASADLFAGRATTRIIDGSYERIEVAAADGGIVGRTAVARSPIELGALWAQERVSELEDRIVAEPESRTDCEREITALGVTHQIQTRFTSFVAIDESSQVDGKPIRVVQPSDVPLDVRRGNLAAVLAQSTRHHLRCSMRAHIEPDMMLLRTRPARVAFNLATGVEDPSSSFDRDTPDVAGAAAQSVDAQVRRAVERTGEFEPDGTLTLRQALLVVIASLDRKASPPAELRARAIAALEAALESEIDPSSLRAVHLSMLVAFLREREGPDDARATSETTSMQDAVIHASLAVAEATAFESLCTSP